MRICVCVCETEKQSTLQHAHECLASVSVLFSSKYVLAYVIYLTEDLFIYFFSSDVFGTLCVWPSEEVDLMVITYNRVAIELLDNSKKSLCNGQYLAMGADTNLFSSIGCGEECGRRCLVSVLGDCFVSQPACLLCVCYFV